jgi:ABC-type transport system substrate-binding protein
MMFWGCKQPETIVVDESPTTVAPSDTVAEQTGANQASFRKLVVGEYNSITSLDPLFAQNSSAMRAVQLLYEGLVRLNAKGAVVPGMATRWEVSSDSLEYTFHLRSDVFYHDSDIFSAGTGRKMTSQDVKFVFERMAQAGVPPRAAHLFMSIQGFDAYFQEQRNVYNPSERNLEDVSGIRTPNDSTVVFELVEQDPAFLKKLATPLALIYPREAVARTVNAFSPVGTGPFQFSSRQADTSLVFSKFQNYYAASDITLNRVDIVNSTSETSLFEGMSRGNIFLMPQLGPQQLKTLINNDGNLYQAYVERYNLQTTSGITEFALRYNPNANLSTADARRIASLARSDSSSYFNQFPNQLVTSTLLSDTAAANISIAQISQDIFTTFSEDPYIRTYLGSLATRLERDGTQLQMMQIRVPSRNVGLFFTQSYPLIPDSEWQNYSQLFRFQVRQAALLRSEISGLSFNAYPWWFDLREVTLPALENLN